MSDMDENNTKDISYVIRGMPVHLNEFLNKLCALRNIKKSDLIREALVEYCDIHKDDLIKIASGL